MFGCLRCTNGIFLPREIVVSYVLELDTVKKTLQIVNDVMFVVRPLFPNRDKVTIILGTKFLHAFVSTRNVTRKCPYRTKNHKGMDDDYKCVHTFVYMHI